MTFVLVKIIHPPTHKRKQQKKRQRKPWKREFIIEFVLFDCGGLEVAQDATDRGKSEQ